MTEPAPVIIQVSLNGMTRKETNPNVPRTPAEVTADALACLDAGASIIHSHTDDPNFGGTGLHDPQPYIEAWTPIYEKYPDAILYPTIEGGGPHTTIEIRSRHVRELHDKGLLRLAIVDMATSNMGRLDENGVPIASDDLFIVTTADVHYLLDYCRKERLGACIGITEVSALTVFMGFWRSGLVPPGSMVQLGFGGGASLGGLPSTRRALDLYLDILDGADIPWFVAGMGVDPLSNGIAEYGLEHGGNIRIGLEDQGAAATSNVDQVRRAVELIHSAGKRPSTSKEAAEILQLPRRHLGEA